MNPQSDSSTPESEGRSSDFPGRRGGWWSNFLWSLIFPTTHQRVMPTVSGWVLIGLALGIGSAAYNAANNILFITLSLLLACLILSGVMSWINLRGVFWFLLVPRTLRVGQETAVAIELRNRKSLVPVYGLWFDLSARSAPKGPRRPETTFRATSGAIKMAFARLEKSTERTILVQRKRLDPKGETRLEWSFTPSRRGGLQVELTSVGSLFPFGFLRKSRGVALRREGLVWPAPVEYQMNPVAAAPRSAEGARLAKVGAGNDLLALRRYQPGDSHRLIHWKASARLRRLMVRQCAAESSATYFLRIDTAPGLWLREEQFELMCGFAATLAEDFFTEGRLVGAAVDSGPAIAIRKVRDLESFLDQLALVDWQPAGQGGGAGGKAWSGSEGEESEEKRGAAQPRRNVITFAPQAVRGVAAYVDGQITATT
jgi:uncharacterized protein (DUF58 family)